MKARLFPQLAAIAGASALLAAAAGAQTTASCGGGTCTVWDTDVTTPTTWCDGGATSGGTEDTIILDRPIFVSSVLTIEPGCIVRGQPRTAAFNPGDPTANAPGVLVISQDGYLDAQGSATNPITFTTAAPDETDTFGVAGADGRADDTDDDPATGLTAWTSGDDFLDDTPTTNPLSPLDAAGAQNVQLWGGVVILGHAPTNLEDDFALGYGRAPVEGLAVPGFPAAGAIYGGEEPHDSSGVIRYVSVRHAGDVIGAANELNGVTLGGVGDGTIFENIEIYTNQDDGIEYFGGTSNARNLVISYVGDDSLDLDQGYNGSIQNVFAISTPFNQDSGTDYGNGGSGDALGEWDGDDNTGNVNVQQSFIDADLADNSWPNGAPAIYNMTGFGNQHATATNPAVSAAGANRGIRMRNDFVGILGNSIIVNTGTACYTVEVPNDLADVPENVHVYSTTCSSETLAPDAGGVDAADRGDTAVNDGEVDCPSGTDCDNFCVGGTCEGGVGAAAETLLVNTDSYFEPKCAGATVAGKLDGCKGVPMDPRPEPTAPAAQVGRGIRPAAVGLDRSATHRGAFPAGQPLWTDTWTALDQGDLL
ncbi:MAG: hypothetical protein ACQGVC_20020 [Myxococcota bacterium]